MGITSLLQTLQPCTRKINISEYAGQKVAVDAYCWLHKAAYSCSSDLCQGIPTNAYIAYCVSFLKMMQYHKIIPVVVFDGGRLPSKAATEDDRRHKRELNKSKGMEYLREGNVTAATSCFQRGVDITPQMAYNLIKVLRDMKIEYIVAPFEADAQLAFLAVNHFVHAVVTEDSDLVAYGCPRVLFKMDKMGNGQEVRINEVFLCKNPSFINWNQQMFLHMCILCGCDFLDSLPGVGPKKAHTLIKKYRDIDKALAALRTELGMKMPPEFENDFRKAELTFKHQRVWDPAKDEVVHLNELTEDAIQQDLSFLGQDIDKETGYLIAHGDIDPHSRKPFENEVPVNARAKSFSFQSVSFAAKLKAANMLPTQKSTIPNYFLKGSTASTKPFVPPAKLDDKSNSQHSSDEDKAPPTTLPSSPPRLTSFLDEDVLAQDTPPKEKKRIVISRFFGGGAGGSPKVTPSSSFSVSNPSDLNEIDALNDSVDKTPTKNIGIKNTKLGETPEAPITFDDEDDLLGSTTNSTFSSTLSSTFSTTTTFTSTTLGSKWRAFDNNNNDFENGNGNREGERGNEEESGSENRNENGNVRVEDDVLVYASSSHRTGNSQIRNQVPPYAPLPAITNPRISSSRLSLSTSDKTRAANETKRTEVHNRFGGFLQQFAFGISSPSALSSSSSSVTSTTTSLSITSPPSDANSNSPLFVPSDTTYSTFSPHSHSHSPDPPPEDDCNFVADSQESKPPPPPSLFSPPPSLLSPPPSLFSPPLPQTSHDLSSDPTSSSTTKSQISNLNSNSNSNISNNKTSKKIVCKIDDDEDDDLFSFPQYNNQNINMHFFKQRNEPTSSSSPPPTSASTSASTSTSTSAIPLSSSSSSSSTSSKQPPFTPNTPFSNKFSSTLTLSHPPSSTSLPASSSLDDSADIVGDSPTGPAVPTKRPIFGDICIGDSDGEGSEEKKHPLGTKRKIRASSLLTELPPSPDHHSGISRKLTPQNLFGRDNEDLSGSDKGMKKMRLEPHSLLQKNSDEDANDSPSGKKDQLRLHDKSLGDTDLSASPSSKHSSHTLALAASPSPSPSSSPAPLSRTFSGSLARPRDTTPLPAPFSLSSDVDLLSSSHDFLDQFKFSGSTGPSYIPSSTRHFLTRSGSPATSPTKSRFNNRPLSTKSPFSSNAHISSSPSSAIVID